MVAPRVKIDWSKYPLHVAAFEGDIVTVEQLLRSDHGVAVNEIASSKNPETPNRYTRLDDRVGEQTALYAAACMQNNQIVALLIDHGADSNVGAPLWAASRSGDVTTATFLIEEVPGIDVDCRGWNGLGPLHEAALGGHITIVRMLISAGANVNLKDHAGYTPLCCAVSGNHKEIVRLLLESGADPNVIVQDDICPVPVASRRPHGWAQVTPLHHASVHGAEEIVQLLLANGADFYARDVAKAAPPIASLLAGRGQTIPDEEWHTRTVRENARDFLTEVIPQAIAEGVSVIEVRKGGLFFHIQAEPTLMETSRGHDDIAKYLRELSGAARDSKSDDIRGELELPLGGPTAKLRFSICGEDTRIEIVAQSLQDVTFVRRRTRVPEQLLCPYCGCKLATDQAKQCFSCGMDWHDRKNVVMR